MSEGLTIKSHKGPYSVFFNDELLANPEQLLDGQPNFIVDANVARLYSNQLSAVLNRSSTLVIDATEESKSIARIIPVIEKLVANKVRRDHGLIGIGGGIIQDITCFIASTLLRGMNWKFVPTTLLAQADSCIGSKSSINLGYTKNILGTFNPPNEIFVCAAFLETLEEQEVCSGIGEMLKVHAIDSVAAFDRLAADYDALRGDRRLLMAYVRQSLLIKKQYIEDDEFDRGIRNVFNYGHSFGHAIESATDFGVPHGVAVTMGMAMANRIAVLRGLLPERHFVRMRPALRKNYARFAATGIPLDALLSALLKDKKNTSSKLVLIFPTGEDAQIGRHEVVPDDAFRDQCQMVVGEMAA